MALSAWRDPLARSPCSVAKASICGRRRWRTILSWSRLRAASRSFLEPWEPTWPDDDLTRAAFRRRLKRQDDDMVRDEAYSFLIFDSIADELLGGITLGGVRRGVSQSGTLGYWMGARTRAKGA